MLLSTGMITGFNTDVNHDGHVYHVQTEDRGLENPVFESLVYIGGTVVARKRTPYSEHLSTGATEDVIASLLKKQHQVIIAAIKAGRIGELISYSAKQGGGTRALGSEPPGQKSIARHAMSPNSRKPATKHKDGGVQGTSGAAKSESGQISGLDLDRVVSDYFNRNSELRALELKVLTPDVFTAGNNVGLRVSVSYGDIPEDDAVVTVKVIGTAFKPQVHIGRAARDGVASFSLAIPAFSAGTAAIVIEAQSKRGQAELKRLIRRS